LCGSLTRDDDLMPIPSAHSGRRGTVPAARNIVPQIPLKVSAALRENAPAEIATAPPVFVADKRLIVQGVRVVHPECHGKIGRVARGITPNLQLNGIAQTDV